MLGGGIVPGSVTLLGGDPGIGKSTLLLQVAAHVAASAAACSTPAARSPSRRWACGRGGSALAAERLAVVTETDLEAILALATERKAALLVVDSIQTMQLGSVDCQRRRGDAAARMHGCAGALREGQRHGSDAHRARHQGGRDRRARACSSTSSTRCSISRARPSSRFRIVRATKNRFGAVNELGFFAMTEGGLREIRNPSAIFLARAPEPAAGSVVTVTREGGRPLLIELQALVDRMRFGAPRRIAQGLDANRVAMLLAVLNRHGGVSLQEHDVFVNVVGGIQINETAWDLPVVLALASSLKDKALPTFDRRVRRDRAHRRSAAGGLRRGAPEGSAEAGLQDRAGAARECAPQAARRVAGDRRGAGGRGAERAFEQLLRPAAARGVQPARARS